MSVDESIIIVTGLPRSGTSLMMQMLQAGGLPLLIDDHRPPDINIPRGYFEYEKVKSLAADSTWIGEARGKALKVIAQLTPFLPLGFQYKVLFKVRNVDEILRSQAAMIQSRGGKVGDSAEVGSIFRRQVDAVRSMLCKWPQTALETVEHGLVLSSSVEAVDRISSFLNRTDLNKRAMIAAINPDLYRMKSIEPLPSQN